VTSKIWNKGLMSGLRQDWETPNQLFWMLNERFHFTLDACAIAANAKVPRFLSPENDGLHSDWSGVVWCNPPYGRGLGKWVEKAFRERHCERGPTVVMLLPARTDTSWFHDYVLRAEAVEFLRGRLEFEHPNRTGRSRAPFPSMIVVFGKVPVCKS